MDKGRMGLLVVVAGTAMLGALNGISEVSVGPQEVYAGTPGVPVVEPCGPMITVSGSASSDGAVLIAYTNSLVYISPCHLERILHLLGTEVNAIGPILTVSDAYGFSRWAGGVTAESEVAVAIPSGEASWISFTNDTVSVTEDRNLILQLNLHE